MDSLNKSQRRKLSDICANLGVTIILAALGFVVVPPVDRPIPLVIIILGLFIGGYLIGLSIKYLKEDRK